MNPTLAIQIVDAFMGDNWAGVEAEHNDYMQAARVLIESGMLASLPGRYGRAVQSLLFIDAATRAEYHEHR